MADRMKVVGGSFHGTEAAIINGEIHVHTKPGFLYDLRYPKNMVAGVDLVTEENKARVGMLIATGGLGALLTGGVHKKEITAVIRFKDGKKLMATMSNDAYKKVKAMTL